MTEDQYDNYTCEAAREDFSALLDGELSAEERTRLEHHLANGPASCTCLADLEAMRRVGEAYRGLPRAQAPSAFPERVHAAIARRKRWQTAQRVAVRRVLPADALAAGLLLVAGSYLWPAPSADPARDTLAHHFDTGAGSTGPTAAEEAPETAFGAQSDRSQPGEPPAPAPQSRAVRAPAPDGADAMVEDAPSADTPEAAPPRADKAAAETGASDADVEPLVRRAAFRMFREQDGIWTQAGFDAAQHTLQTLTRDSAAWHTLLDQEPRLAELAAWDAAVRFRYAGAWYLIEAPGPG